MSAQHAVACACPPVPAPARRGSVELSPVSPEAWTAEIARFADGSFAQAPSFLASKWGAHRVRCCVVRRDGALIGGAALRIFAPPVLGRGLAYVKFGPLWRRCGKPASADDHRFVVEALFEEFAVRQGHMLTVVPRPNPDHAEAEAERLRELGFRVRRPNPDPERFLVDLSLPPEEQMASLGQKWRYNLRRAGKAGLEVREVPGREGTAAFARLYGAMLERKRIDSPDAVDDLDMLADGLPAGLRPRTALAYHGDRAVAGAVFGTFGDTAHYLYGASADEAPALCAGYALQWWLVERLSGNGARWYDLGGSPQDSRLRQFKAGLVGRRGAVIAMPDEFDAWSGPLGRVSADAMFAIRDLRARLSLRPGKAPEA